MLHKRGELGCKAVGHGTKEGCPPPAGDRAHLGVAEPGCRFQKRLQDRLQVERRAADDLEHVGGGGLLLEGLAQLVEEAGILDGDDRLPGKALEECYLLVRERTDLLAIDRDDADGLIFLEHPYRKHRNPATAL